jgi:hypothetical protein
VNNKKKSTLANGKKRAPLYGAECIVRNQQQFNGNRIGQLGITNINSFGPDQNNNNRQ